MRGNEILNAPYTFDKPAYAHCYDVPQMCMDKRHVYVIHEILKSYEFKSAIELGSFMGASSTAFIEAINGGSKMRAEFCDIEVRPSLDAVVSSCIHQDQVKIVKGKSWDVLSDRSREYDLIVVDANHDYESVARELDHLLDRLPLCIIAHDTSATKSGYRNAEGAAFLAKVLTQRAYRECGYREFRDDKIRAGEETNRGLSVFCNHNSLSFQIKKAFKKNCGD